VTPREAAIRAGVLVPGERRVDGPGSPSPEAPRAVPVLRLHPGERERFEAAAREHAYGRPLPPPRDRE